MATKQFNSWKDTKACCPKVREDRNGLWETVHQDLCISESCFIAVFLVVNIAGVAYDFWALILMW